MKPEELKQLGPTWISDEQAKNIANLLPNAKVAAYWYEGNWCEGHGALVIEEEGRMGIICLQHCSCYGPLDLADERCDWMSFTEFGLRLSIDADGAGRDRSDDDCDIAQWKAIEAWWLLAHDGICPTCGRKMEGELT